MRQYYVDVRVGGSQNHVVTNKLVTVPEIALLRAIHGNSDVFNLRPGPDVEDFSEDMERERLHAVYERSNIADQKGLMERLFGVNGRLPVTLRDIGIDATAAAKQAKADAAAAKARADAMEEQAAAEEAGAEGEAAAEAAMFT